MASFNTSFLYCQFFFSFFCVFRNFSDPAGSLVAVLGKHLVPFLFFVFFPGAGGIALQEDLPSSGFDFRLPVWVSWALAVVFWVSLEPDPTYPRKQITKIEVREHEK